MNELGVRYETGKGVKQDIPRAYARFQDAALLMNAHANYKIGVAYHNGSSGFTQNKPKAFDFYKRGAQLGDKDAQRMFGFMNLKGINYSRKDNKIIQEERNIIQAVYWYTQSKDLEIGEILRSHL